MGCHRAEQPTSLTNAGFTAMPGSISGYRDSKYQHKLFPLLVHIGKSRIEMWCNREDLTSILSLLKVVKQGQDLGSQRSAHTHTCTHFMMEGCHESLHHRGPSAIVRGKGSKVRGNQPGQNSEVLAEVSIGKGSEVKTQRKPGSPVSSHASACS